jgi:GxxExxY protein
MLLIEYISNSVQVCLNRFMKPSWLMNYESVDFAIHQQALPVIHEKVRMDIGFRADLVVEGKIIVEIKSLEILAPVHKKQLLTYLRVADKRLGLLVNFGEALIKDGITRAVNRLPE